MPDGGKWGGGEEVKKQVEEKWRKYKEKHPNSKKKMKTTREKVQFSPHG